MKILKRILILILFAIILLAGIGGVVWHNQHYLMIDSKRYRVDATTLDLRGEDISIKQYERFREKLPGCRIFWNIPFQGARYPEDTKELTISALAPEDIRVMDYLTKLKTVDASACTDYAQLEALKAHRPELEVRYSIVLNGTAYAPDTTQIAFTSVSQEDLDRLSFLKQLETVTISGGENTAHFSALRQYCIHNGLAFRVQLGDMLVDESTQALTTSGFRDAEAELLQYLPQLTQLHLLNPQASIETLTRVQTLFPQIQLTWNQEVCGKPFSSTDTEIDLSGTQVTDLELLAKQMTYFPQVKQLILSDCGLDNETLAQFREDHRGEYKVIWTVQLGDHLTARTDDTTFMPTREGVYYFQDHESGNLKYCEEMVCMDVGHMAIHDISFVSYMPNLKYLILAHTEVRDITPLETCKNLVFLELDWSTVRDFTPLLGCTALEDLNIGNTYPDVTPITKMTWLKNLWMVGRGSAAYPLTEALPDTKIVASGSATVAGGWRELPNYFAMRDMLGMPYMTW